MPIRTRRGRSAAYRGLWEWPLHSPVRFVVVMVLLAVVVGGVAYLGTLGSSRSGRASGALAPVPDVPTVTAVPAAPVGAAAGAHPDHAAALGRPARRARGRPALGDRLGRPPRRGDRRAVERPAARPTPPTSTCRSSRRSIPATSPPPGSPAPPQAVEVRPESLRVQVPTDAVTLQLLLVAGRPRRLARRRLRPGLVRTRRVHPGPSAPT